MTPALRRPEEILARRSLREILFFRPQQLWTVRSADTALWAMQVMADKNVGLVVVLDRNQLVGVLSERDCVRRAILLKKPIDTTLVADVMTREVITVDPSQSYSDCLKLMHQHRIRHLPVVDSGRPITVVSIRDLLSEAVQHHAKIIAELERERLTIFTSTA
jgi:signal-transduction protein with cAMP-binding, CBS, and nucleotidyltransferase domain